MTGLGLTSVFEEVNACCCMFLLWTPESDVLLTCLYKTEPTRKIRLKVLTGVWDKPGTEPNSHVIKSEILFTRNNGLSTRVSNVVVNQRNCKDNVAFKM